jgi:hypothetical protein
MKSKILFSILGMILLLGAVYAGGAMLSERNAKLTTEQSTALTTKGINDFQTTKLDCKEEYCTFWISKENVINSERRIEKYKEVCEDKILEVKPEECEKEEGTLTDKEVCIKKVCNQVAKTEIELVNERTNIVDGAIEGIANEIIKDNSKSPIVSEVGTDEKVIVNSVKPK